MLNLSLTNIRNEKVIRIEKIKENIIVSFSKDFKLVVENTDESNTIGYYKQFENKIVISYLITINCIYLFFEDTTMLVLLTDESAYYLTR